MCKTMENKDETEKKTMNYIAVAKHEMKCAQEENIPDGWVKMTREKNGNITKKWGKEVANQTMCELEKNDKIHHYLKMQQRHSEYKTQDSEIYYTDYKYSWESEHESDSNETEFSEDSDDDESDKGFDSDNDY